MNKRALDPEARRQAQLTSWLRTGVVLLGIAGLCTSSVLADRYGAVMPQVLILFWLGPMVISALSALLVVSPMLAGGRGWGSPTLRASARLTCVLGVAGVVALCGDVVSLLELPGSSVVDRLTGSNASLFAWMLFRVGLTVDAGLASHASLALSRLSVHLRALRFCAVLLALWTVAFALDTCWMVTAAGFVSAGWFEAVLWSDALQWARLGLACVTLIGCVPVWRAAPFVVRGAREHECPECGYELAGLKEHGCPECGWGRGGESTKARRHQDREGEEKRTTEADA